MDQSEQLFLKKLRATFKVEALDHVHEMSSNLLALEKADNPQNRAERLATIFRHAHSLKGAARAVNLRDIETVCQAMEDVFDAWKISNRPASPHALDKLHRAVDQVGQFLLAEEAETANRQDLDVSSVVQDLAELALPLPASDDSPRETDLVEHSTCVEPDHNEAASTEAATM